MAALVGGDNWMAGGHGQVSKEADHVAHHDATKDDPEPGRRDIENEPRGVLVSSLVEVLGSWVGELALE